MKGLCAVLAACSVFCFAAYSQGQTAIALDDHSPEAEITFGGGGSLKTRSAEGLFGRVGAVTNQAVVVRLQYPSELGGKPILIQSLDGAQVLGNAANLAAGADGMAIVQLRLGASEGLYRFALACGDARTLLRFYASKPGNPSPDPTLLRPATTE